MSQYYKGQIDIYKEMICVACRHVLVVTTVGIRVACVNNSATFTKVCLPVSGQREHSVHSHEVSLQVCHVSGFPHPQNPFLKDFPCDTFWSFLVFHFNTIHLTAIIIIIEKEDAKIHIIGSDFLGNFGKVSSFFW